MATRSNNNYQSKLFLGGYFQDVKKRSRFFKLFILPFFLFIVTTAAPNLGRLSTHANSSCYPQNGWTWAGGPSQPEIAARAQLALSQIGIMGTVEARSFGEVDSCGTFVPTAIDFTITPANQYYFSEESKDELATKILPVLLPLGKPSLGNVKLKLSPNGEPGLGDTFINLAPLNTAYFNYNVSSGSGQLAFVSLSGDNTLSVLDTSDNSIIQTGISVGNSPAGAIFSPDGERLYVRNVVDNSVSVVDTQTYQVIATILVGAGPRGIAVSKDGSRVYVSNNASLSLSIIDTVSLTVAKTISLTAHPEEIALSPDGQRLFISATVPFVGYILDTATETLLESFDSSAGNGIAITPDGKYAYISNWNNTVNVVDLATMIAIKTITVDNFPHRVTISPDGQRAYVANLNSNNVSVIDTSSNEVVATIPVGGSPWAMDVLDDNSRLYVPTGAETVAVIDTATNTVLEQVPVGAEASSIAIFHNSPSSIHKKVFVLVYDPLLSNDQNLSTYLGWNDYVDINLGTISLFKQASNNHLWYDIVDTTIVTDGWPVLSDGYQYDETTYLDVVNQQIPPPSNAMVNYNAILDQFDICERANQGEFDEVWIFNGPYFGFYESTLVGPGAYWFNSPPVPEPHNCERLIPIMGPSPERGVAEAVHNFGHRQESTMTEVYGVWNQNSTSNSWEKFTLVDALSPNYSYSGCGNIHYPPNASNDYEYSNSASAMSNCNDFYYYPNLHDPLTVLQSLTCSAWGCEQVGYLDYWFNHLPSSTGCGSDEVANNWWKYFIEPSLALAPSSTCQTTTPILNLNFTSGQPGSFFTLTGTNYPPNTDAALMINGNHLGTTTTNSSGDLLFVLDTSVADVGWYFATIAVTQNISNPDNFTPLSSFSISFVLDPKAPLRPQTDIGTMITIPSGMSFAYITRLPIIIK